MTRHRLEDRRENEALEIEHIWRGASGDVAESMLVTIGRYSDGRIGEVFIDYPPRQGERKKSDRVKDLGADIAVLISIALQYGAPLEVLRAATGRSEVNIMGKLTTAPHTHIGTVLDALAATGQCEPLRETCAHQNTGAGT